MSRNAECSTRNVRYMQMQGGGDSFGGNLSSHLRFSFFDHQNDSSEVPCGFLKKFPISDSGQFLSLPFHVCMSWVKDKCMQLSWQMLLRLGLDLCSLVWNVKFKIFIFNFFLCKFYFGYGSGQFNYPHLIYLFLLEKNKGKIVKALISKVLWKFLWDRLKKK